MATRASAAIDEQRREFLENPYVGVVTTVHGDGSLQSTVVWVDVDDEGVSFNTAEGRAKPRHLRKTPNVSVLVVDPNDPYRWVSVSGRAELRHEGADAQIDRLAKKYLGKDEYPFRQSGEQRISVRIHPQRIDSLGLDED
jgi:PPOX class probable F420-dependent enzyme